MSRRLAALYLVVESIGVVAWWLLLAASPVIRSKFVASGAPDAVLFAFAPADAIFVSTGLLAARALGSVGSPSGWLRAHAAMAAYAGLYSISLPLFGGGAWLGALLMLPVLVLSPAIAWRFGRGIEQ